MSAGEKRPEWMQDISSTVNPDDYLLGRKIDKTFELSQREKAEKAKEIRANLIASDKLKLVGDPILELQRRKDQIKYEILTNPIRLKQFKDFLKRRDKNHDHSRTSKDRDRHSDRHTSRHRDHGRHHHRHHHDHRHERKYHRRGERDSESRDRIRR